MTGPADKPPIDATAPRRSAEIACPACGAGVIAGLPFCPSCGKGVLAPVAGPACARCGTPAVDSSKYCAACGHDLGARASLPKVTPSGPPSEITVVLLDESGAEVSRYPVPMGDTTIGRQGAELEFPDDVFMSPLHVQLTPKGDALQLRDLGSRNGTWYFIVAPHLLIDGDRLLVGSQVLEYRRLGYPGPHPPERDATRRMGSLVPSADIACLTQLRADGSTRDIVHLSPGRNIRLGRDQGDYTFPYDPSMSGLHAEIRSEDADFVAVDTGSRNGVALAVRGEVTLGPGGRFLVGDKMLRVEPA